MSTIAVCALSGSDSTNSTLRGESNLVFVDNSRKHDWVVAVDAGLRPSDEIAARLVDVGIHTLILTHDDSDHIGGAQHVLGKSKEAVSELWVPAYWMMQDKLLRQLANSNTSTPDEGEIAVAAELAGAASSADIGWLSAETFTPLFEIVGVADDIDFLDPVEAAEYDPDVIMEDLWGAFADLSARKISAYRLLSHDLRHPWNGAAGPQMAERTLKRIHRINNILREAQQRGTKIRCFLPAVTSGNPRADSFAAWRTQGVPGSLTILNAVEVRIVEPKLISRAALRMALVAVHGLSIQNRAALVPFVWPTEGNSGDGFVVWSDSSGEWTNEPQFRVPWEHVGGMTAPHHGSGNTAHDAIWNEMAQANGVSGRNMAVVVSGDLRKTPSSTTRSKTAKTTRSKAVKTRLTTANPVAYGVVHCLEASDSRSPRREVLYWSSRHLPYWRNSRLYSFRSVACGSGCAGCYRNR